MRSNAGCLAPVAFPCVEAGSALWGIWRKRKGLLESWLSCTITDHLVDLHILILCFIFYRRAYVIGLLWSVFFIIIYMGYRWFSYMGYIKKGKGMLMAACVMSCSVFAYSWLRVSAYS